jgi:hypothetical protein
MSSEPEPRATESHALAALAGVPAPALAALKQQWIETAEQVLALAASPIGRRHLQQLLQYDESQLESLLAALRQAVGPEAAARFLAPQPGGSLGLALTEEQQERFGIRTSGKSQGKASESNHNL